MCAFKAPRIPKTPPAAQFQQVQVPKNLTQSSDRLSRRRRGMWASIMTSPQGLPTPPSTTGGSAGVTGA